MSCLAWLDHNGSRICLTMQQSYRTRPRMVENLCAQLWSCEWQTSWWRWSHLLRGNRWFSTPHQTVRWSRKGPPWTNPYLQRFQIDNGVGHCHTRVFKQTMHVPKSQHEITIQVILLHIKVAICFLHTIKSAKETWNNRMLVMRATKSNKKARVLNTSALQSLFVHGCTLQFNLCCSVGLA